MPGDIRAKEAGLTPIVRILTMTELLSDWPAGEARAAAHRLVHRLGRLDAGQDERTIALIRRLARAFRERHPGGESEMVLRNAFHSYAHGLTLPLGNRTRQWLNLKAAVCLYPAIATRKAFLTGLMHCLRGGASVREVRGTPNA